MNYYKIKIATINKVVGSIASDHMTKEYNFNNYNSVYKLKPFGKLDFIPDFNSIEILNRAKLLDIILSVPVSAAGIIISDKLLEVIKQFKLPEELQVFDVNAIHKGIDYHYNYFYLYNPKQKEYLNFNEMLFYETNMVGVIKKELEINNYDDYLNLRRENKLIQINPKKIILHKEKINTDIFRLSLISFGYYVSEKLKEAIEKANCQGIEFTPIEELNYTIK